MEENRNSSCSASDLTSASYSWWLDTHNRPNQSLWLHATLSELDRKIKMMIEVIEEDGDTFAKRAEMYYKKRPELIRMVEDLHRSYRALADKYDQLTLRSSSSSSISFRQQPTRTTLEADPKRNSIDSQDSLFRPPKSTTDHHHYRPESESSRFEFERSLKRRSLEEELVMSSDRSKDKGKKTETDKKMGNDVKRSESEKMWNEMRLKVSSLMENSMEQQEELIRRNKEKREMISELCGKMNRLMDENRELKSCLAGCNGAKANNNKQNHSHISKLKGAFLRKFGRS